MRALVVGLAVALAFAVPLAGCLSPEAEPEPGPAAENTRAAGTTAQPTKAGIKGTVVDQGFTPVVGASVNLLQGTEPLAETMSDERGRYGFADLEPGEYVVRVNAACCREAILRIDAAAGDPVNLDVRLEELPSITPFVLEEVWYGHLGCSAFVPGWGYITQACQNTDPNHDGDLEFQLRPGLKTILIVMEWEQAQTNLLDHLRLTFQRGSANFLDIQGESPLIARVGPEAAGGDLDFVKITEPWDVRFLVRASNDPASFAYQQPFTIHYHLYYLEEAPEGATALT